MDNRTKLTIKLKWKSYNKENSEKINRINHDGKQQIKKNSSLPWKTDNIED